MDTHNLSIHCFNIFCGSRPIMQVCPHNSSEFFFKLKFKDSIGNLYLINPQIIILF